VLPLCSAFKKQRNDIQIYDSDMVLSCPSPRASSMLRRCSGSLTDSILEWISSDTHRWSRNRIDRRSTHIYTQAYTNIHLAGEGCKKRR
jgi:hypothetical protein